MGKIIGIVLVVAAIWLAANYVTRSTSSPEDEGVTRTVPQRAGDKVRDAYQEGTELRERIMPEE